MEIRFVTLALKRLWWLPVLLGLVGLILGGRLTSAGDEQFESTALILVQPSDDSISPAQSTAPDRFVASQISLLESNQISENVAELLGGTETSLTISRSLEFSQQEESDVVEVVARTESAERSQAIAQATADVYIAELNDRVEALFAPEVAELNAEITAIDAELTEVNTALAEAAAPFLNQLGNQSPIPVPAIDVLDPAAATRRATLLAERASVRSRLDALSLATDNAVNSEIIQGAQLPDERVSNSLAPLRYAIAVIFALLGTAIALATTRFSSTVIDDRDIETALRRPIEARVPRSAKLAGSLPNALQLTGKLNAEESAVVSELDRLASRIELASDIRGTRIVGIGGAQLGSGSSAVATALAGRFAQRGNRTVLIDADSTEARVTSELGAPPKLHLTDFESELPVDYGRTSLANLITLGIDRSDQTRRIRASALARGLRSRADIIVIDLGDLLTSTSASQLIDELDLLLMTFPKDKQSIEGLAQISRTFESVGDRILPIINDPAPARGKKSIPFVADRAKPASLKPTSVSADAA